MRRHSRLAIAVGSAISAIITCCALAAGTGLARAAAAGERAIPASGASPVWGVAEQVPGITTLDHNGSAILSAVSCAAKGACSAGGCYVAGSTTYDEAFAAGESGGVWGSAQDVPTVPMLNTGHDAQVMTISCLAAGNCGAAGYYRDASKVTYGHEQSAKVSVTVCVITLKAGTGSCALAPNELKPGSYALVARYRGQPEFNGSASAKKTLKVVK